MDTADLVQRMLAQATEHALILMDPDGRTVGWLMGAKQIFGREADEMLGQTLERLFTDEDRAARTHLAELETARAAGVAEDDRWMLRSDRLTFWASGFVYRLCDDHDRIVGFAKFVRDRTDVRGQVEALRNRAESLAAEDRRKTLVLGTLAHELRNPLGALLNAAQLIDIAYPGDEKLAYALQIVRRQTAYVSKLIEDLLEVVRVRTGKAVLQVEIHDLRALVEESVETVAGDVAARRQRVELLFPLSPIRLEADRIRLRQVFVNLLANASKFSDAGARILVKASIEGGDAVVRIEDQGRGIPANLLPRVFDLLAQATPGERAGSAGLGLGLSIVKEYVELHRGVVQVRSDGLDRGSEFTVRVPLKQNAGA
jgi:two-component system CheB/CheR fusion protein